MSANLAALAMAAEASAAIAAVVRRHEADDYPGGPVCVWCSRLAGRPIAFPCPDRVDCGRVAP